MLIEVIFGLFQGFFRLWGGLLRALLDCRLWSIILFKNNGLSRLKELLIILSWVRWLYLTEICIVMLDMLLIMLCWNRIMNYPEFCRDSFLMLYLVLLFSVLKYCSKLSTWISNDLSCESRLSSSFLVIDLVNKFSVARFISISYFLVQLLHFFVNPNFIKLDPFLLTKFIIRCCVMTDFFIV